MDLAAFNALPPDEAAEVVGVWAAIDDWTRAVVGGRPYPTVDALDEAARTASLTWTEADLAAAIAHHPRIGERAVGADRAAAASRSEQASMADADAEVTAAIAAAGADYEARFDRVFLIRAAGRTPAEMLSEARRRLRNDPVTETVEVREQLRQIALLRLRTTVTEEPA
ncbi:2-oxo-4-hydroxy-4-carboxy-5-ureidoimidazoline decarboxylase [Microbacterium sp.]|uniref:2-oxo-4-hydroxy-4-carboxy-5-ureidoimidazoline decarboxylase n=1 Tax=Microbacterium sp. TaxID=51671 RepID=UPI003A86862D